MQPDLPVLIAAAGLGSRLGMNLPKCLVEVNGRTLLERLLSDVLGDERDVRLVVGFRADEVIAAARRVRDDVIFVRNPAYRDTSVRHSFWLAARHVRGPSIIVDGDTLVAPGSYRAFRRAAAHVDTLVGITPARTTDAVFAATAGAVPRATAFSRTQRAPHEWCGIAKLPAGTLSPQVEYVFECIQRLLPAPAFVLDVAEVDTREDLARAEAFARRLDAADGERRAVPASLAGA